MVIRRRRTPYRFRKDNKPVNAIALQEILDTHDEDDARDDDIYLEGDLIADMPHDQFYGWEKAGLVRAATPDEVKAAKAEAAKETAKAA
jgi:ribosomal protein L21E